MHTVLWKRLDQEGYDACQFTQTAEGWIIQGAAVFEYGENGANLAYQLECDRPWASQKASVSGWIGKSSFQLHTARAVDKAWSINGKVHENLSGLQDIDLGFTPASNTNVIRRLSLSEGDEAMSVAVWLDTENWTVKPLPQTYRRIRNNAYEYESPRHNYRATLLVDGFQAVAEYPELWMMLNPVNT